MKKLCLCVLGLFAFVSLPVFGADSELVALAKKEKARRAKVEAKKTFTNQDITKIKEKQLGIETTDAVDTKDQKTASKEPADTEKKESVESEEHWRARREAAQARVDAAKKRVDELQSDVNALSRAYYSGTGDGVAQHSVVESQRGERLSELDAAKKELDDAMTELTGLEDEARRAGVPPGWVR